MSSRQDDLLFGAPFTEIVGSEEQQTAASGHGSMVGERFRSNDPRDSDRTVVVVEEEETHVKVRNEQKGTVTRVMKSKFYTTRQSGYSKID